MIPTKKEALSFGSMLIAFTMAILGFAFTQANAQEITQAEQILFLSNHFADTKPQTITYRYHHDIEGAAPYTDEVSVDVLELHHDGTASIAMRFLSGDRKIHIPALESAQGNPAILGFLEGDIAEMKRLTGGSTAYFRKSIRMALAMPETKVIDKTIIYEGHPIKGQEISIRPYASDPNKARLGNYANKSYVFVMSDAVPGKLYSIYTNLTGADSPLGTSLTISSGVSPE